MIIAGRKTVIARQITMTVLAVLALGACSTTQSDPQDPFEGYNRVMFSVNDAMDQAVMRPIAVGYRAVVPQPARTGVRNFLRNLRAPVNLANEMLQGDLDGAGNVVVRTSVNTLIGVGGLIDVAAMEGMPYEHEDFGQTLGVWGFGHGAYMVLPLIGPSSVRDGTGLLVDGFMDPLRWYLFNTDQEEWYYGRLAATAIDAREELLDVLDDLRRNSFDYYAAVRSAYLQRREALVHDMGANGGGADIPNYDAGEE